MIQNTINSSSYSNNSENEIADENNSGKNNKNIDGNYPQKISLVPSVELIIKNEKQNINDLYKNIGPQMSPEMSQLINFFSNQLKDITTALEDKINLQNLKIVQHEKDITNLNQRIHKLEVNQLMLYHQISLYQSSRDMYNSICFYYYDYLNLKQVRPNCFDKIKAIIVYLEETEEEKIKQMIENGDVSIPEDKKKKLVNYFRFHNFVSFVINIIHRNFQETQKKILEEQKNDDLLPLLPNFDFEQVFIFK